MIQLCDEQLFNDDGINRKVMKGMKDLGCNCVEHIMPPNSSFEEICKRDNYRWQVAFWICPAHGYKKR